MYIGKVILCIIVIVILMWAIPMLNGNANKDFCIIIVLYLCINLRVSLGQSNFA